MLEPGALSPQTDFVPFVTSSPREVERSPKTDFLSLASSIVDVADTAAKAAAVTLFRIHLAMAIGGKGYVMLTGDVASVEAAVSAGATVASEEGILVARAVIAAPRKELFREFV
jgi:microcompartment protein CcmL/EutN